MHRQTRRRPRPRPRRPGNAAAPAGPAGACPRAARRGAGPRSCSRGCPGPGGSSPVGGTKACCAKDRRAQAGSACCAQGHDPRQADRAGTAQPRQGADAQCSSAVVAIGAINKRTGETRIFTGNPGQGFDFGSLHVTVRTCEQTPPWDQKLTGAFLLIDERLANGGTKRVYSGWMFAESPSLHPLEHPRYDIWVKSCTMRWPDTGPDTVVAGKGDAGPRPRSRARRSRPKRPSAPPN